MELSEFLFREGGSEEHLRDNAGVLGVMGEQLAREYIESWARKLGLTDIWAAVLGA